MDYAGEPDRQKAPGRLAADAVTVEPVSTLKFPANREKNREFFNFGPDCGSELAIRPMIRLT
jgi:hypothetical protein